MTTNNRKVLVTGATGKQGGSVVRHMLGNGWNLVALTRDPKSKTAKALLESGVEVLQCNMEDASSLAGAFRGKTPGCLLVSSIITSGLFPRLQPEAIR